jgi:hypothetical protein
VLKRYLYDPVDCVRHMIAIEPGKVYRKDNFFSILLYSINIRLVSFNDPSLVSLFFQDELLVLVLYFVFINRGEINFFQIYNMVSSNSMELDSLVNLNESPSNGYSTYSHSDHEHLESIICNDTLILLI